MSIAGIFLFMLLALGAFLVTVGTLIFRTFHQISASPQSNGFRNTIERMQKTLADRAATLVPWQSDTLSLLCAEPMEATAGGFFIKTKSEGLLGTIYQEPVAAFTKSQTGDALLLLVHTQADQYLLRRSRQQTDIQINNQPIGVLVGNKLLSADNTGKLLAQIDGEDGASERSLTIDNQLIGTLTLKHPVGEVNPRVIQVMQSLTPEQERLATALALYFVLCK
jgi:hypothetical protein